MVVGSMRTNNEDVIGMRFASLQLGHNRVVQFRTEKQKWKRVHKMFNMENPNVGKTTAAHRLQKITMREEYRDREAQSNNLLHPFFATRRLQ